MLALADTNSVERGCLAMLHNAKLCFPLTFAPERTIAFVTTSDCGQIILNYKTLTLIHLKYKKK